MSFYREIRAGVAPDARRLSVGRNLFPPSPALREELGRIWSSLLAGERLTTYETDADERERSLVADLLGRYLDLPGLEREDVFFTSGAQEGISLCCSYAAQRGLPAVLPLPLYYSFEQSSARFGVPVSAYYRWDGSVHWRTQPVARVFQALVVPNPITGTLFAPPRDVAAALGPDASFTLIDCVIQLGGFKTRAEVAERTREALRAYDLERTALIFSVSKDLSLPGLRIGVLVTRNRDLLAFARADRFERTYSSHPLAGPVLSLYAALLLQNEGRASAALPGAVSRGELAARFAEAGVAFPNPEATAAILAHFDAMTRRARENLDELVSNCRSLRFDAALTPFAGYSAFPALARGFACSGDFTSWVRRAGVDFGLKLNPNYLFGATPEIWDEIYPGEYRVRVNLSDSPDALGAALERLGAALEAADPPPATRRS